MSVRVRLVTASALMLLLELALIRWLPSHVIHLGYYSNVVLLGSFLGIGIGFLRAGRAPSADAVPVAESADLRPAEWGPESGVPARPPTYFPVALLLLVALATTVPATIDRSGSDLVFFTSVKASGPPAWLALPILFALTAVVMSGPGHLVGACFQLLPRLEAYRWDLIGSLVGIGLFTAGSFLGLPPLFWALLAAAASWLLLGPRPPVLAAACLLGLVGVLALESATPGATWSPYQRVDVERLEATAFGPAVSVLANGVPHQLGADAERKAAADPQYTLPYRRTPNRPERVLVVGAGTGSDVALALGRGAQHVDAVEIDPALADAGRRLHPDRPYDDPRVNVHLDDGRAFLQRTTEQWDLIVFALPDSLTLVSGTSGIRLESYLFTEQAMAAVRSRLTDDGAFSMYNFYREPWLVDRLAATVTEVFGHPPCVDRDESGNRAVISVAVRAEDQVCPATVLDAGTSSGIQPVGDDRPFLYLRTPSVPAQYLLLLSVMVLLSLVAVRVFGGRPRRMAPYTDLLLLGAAFLLLETRSVATFSLLFGTTWVVNALVFAGVLVVVLVAVEAARVWQPRRLGWLYLLLAATLAVNAVVPASWYLSLPVGPRVLAAVVVAFAPIFVANLVFASRFATTADPTAAFAANLLGAMLGGCLEYAALVVGYTWLLGIAVLLYAGAFVLLRRVPALAGT